MEPFSFIHTADLHLDSPFRGLKEINPDIAAKLRDSTFEAFTRVVDLCLERNVDFLVIAGDIYDGADRSLKAQIHFRDELKRLGDEEIYTYVVHGNHDPLDGWRAKLDWPTHVHFFKDKVERVVHVKNDKPIASIYGVSYPKRDIQDNLARQYQRHQDDSYAIGLLHANVGGNTDHESYAPCSLEDLTGSGFNYWALGHIHKQGILNDRDPTVVYPGNPQGRHPGESGEHGCMVVCADSDGRTDLEFVRTDAIRWIEEDISIEGLEREQELLDVIEEQVQVCQDREEGRDLVCRLQLTGRGPLHASLRENRLADILDTVRDSCRAIKPFVWIDRIESATRPDMDIEARYQGQDFVGDFLRLVESYRKNPGQRDTLRRKLEPLFGHRLGRKYLEPLSDKQLQVFLEQAQTLCLDLLLEDD